MIGTQYFCFVFIQQLCLINIYEKLTHQLHAELVYKSLEKHNLCTASSISAQTRPARKESDVPKLKKVAEVLLYNLYTVNEGKDVVSQF
jgi:hypothetical protein